MIRTIAVLGLLGFSFASVADDPLTPEQVIGMRQQGFKDMGAAFKGVRDQFRRPKPVLVMLREYTRPLIRYSREPVVENWFPAGTGPETGLETEALPVIWERFNEFSSLWQDYVQATEQLQVSINAGDLDDARDRTRELGETCKGCHDIFRKPED